MVINYQSLTSQLIKKPYAIYILIGQDHYLLNESAVQIKQYRRQQGEWDGKTLYINQSTDWKTLQEEANSYSLFAEQVWLDVRYEKKTIDAAGKKILKKYLESINSRCVILLRAPLVSARDIQDFSAHEQILLVQASPLAPDALCRWIQTQLQSKCIRFDKSIPTLIQQYTQGNMLACAQAIERLDLVHDKKSELSVALVLEQLSDQCEFQLYELADACLLGQSERAIHLLRQANQQRIEPTLILWLLTQEIRQLNLLLQLVETGMGFSAACAQLKIWSSKTRFYQTALSRFTLPALQQGLIRCGHIDQLIKTSSGNQIWHSMEQLSLFLCTAIAFGI